MSCMERFTKGLDRGATVVSVGTSCAIVALSMAGFASLEGQVDVLDQYFQAVLCVLGGLAGTVLFLAEFNFGWFYRLFGIVKTRTGRALAYGMIGIIVLLGASEEPDPSRVWPGYLLGALCLLCSMMHALGVCLLSTADRERSLWATQGRELVVTVAPEPDSAV